MLNIEWGEHTRVELLQYLIDKKQYTTYLEIGCDKNQVFNNIKVQTKEGVDPNRGGTVRMTSDAFFSKDHRSWDLIFIDGLHEYYQVKRDFENAFTRLNLNGTIIIHDMLPVRKTQAGPLPKEKYWLGNVWCLAFDLMSKPDCKFNIFNFDFGCGIITKDSQTPVCIDFVDDWDFYEKNFDKLPIITFEEYFNA